MVLKDFAYIYIYCVDSIQKCKQQLSMLQEIEELHRRSSRTFLIL